MIRKFWWVKRKEYELTKQLSGFNFFFVIAEYNDGWHIDPFYGNFYTSSPRQNYQLMVSLTEEDLTYLKLLNINPRLEDRLEVTIKLNMAYNYYLSKIGAK